MPVTRKRRNERGIVLLLVLVIGALLTTVAFTLARRSIIDWEIARNRDSIAQAEALARGGVRIATALLVADKLANPVGAPAATGSAAKSTVGLSELAEHFRVQTEDGATLRIKILEEGSRLNLNALVDYADKNARVDDDAIEFLNDFFDKVIDESIPPGEKSLYDTRELAHNFLDYVDRDDVRQKGGPEDDYYQQQRPPYRAANMPLLTVDELGMVEGFTPQLVNAIRPYVTVHPMAGGSGINLNTAPSHVLAAVYHGNAGNRRLISEDDVRRILMARQDGDILCNGGAADDRCILVSEFVDGTIYPAVVLPARPAVFTVVAEANVGEIQRKVEAVVDRSDPANPQILAWRTE